VTKRATLNLYPEAGLNKEQVAGLKPQGNDQPHGRSEPPLGARVLPPPRLQSGSNGSAPQQIRDWPNGKLIVKAICMAGIAALSLYLLRRRFY
jgi:hypothetical protein